MESSDLYQLLSRERIGNVKARYCRYIDTKQWERLPSLFTDDCRFEGLGSAPAGANVATFVAGVSSRLQNTISVHHCHMPEIDAIPAGRPAHRMGQHQATAGWLDNVPGAVELRVDAMQDRSTH